MIFFNLFTERWMAATNGETLEMRGAYIALLVHQYANEAMQLPLNRAECYRIAGAVTESEQHAVTECLRKHYKRTPTGYEQAKVVAEVSRFQAKEPERAVHRERANARKAASRATLQALYALGRQHGLPVTGGMTIVDLRAMLVSAGVQLGPLAEVPTVDRFVHRNGSIVDSGPVSQSDVTESVTESVTPSVTESVTENHPHYPLTTVTYGHTPRARAGAAGEACMAMKASGIVGVNPAHPGLLALLANGCTVDHLAMAAAQAAAKGKGFAYALAIAEGQLRDAATAQAAGPRTKAGQFLAELAPSLFPSVAPESKASL